MLKTKKAFAVLFAIMLFLSAVPTLASAAEEENEEIQGDEAIDSLQRRAEMMLNIAERTANLIGAFIEKVQGNSSLLEKLEDAGLLDDFNGNVSMFEEAKALLNEAETLIEEGNYTQAIEKIREALANFRNAYRAMHRITEEFMATLEVQRRAEGLMVAMNRTLKRLERLEALPGKADGEIAALIEQVRRFLNITEARKLLEAGNVSELAHRLAEANKIMSQIHVQLKARAHMKVRERVRKYLQIAERFMENITERIRRARMAGVNVTEVLQKLGIKNATAFTEECRERIQEAREKADINELLKTVRSLGKELWKVDGAITQCIMKRSPEGIPHGSSGEGGPSGKGQPPFSQQESSRESHHPAEKQGRGRSQGLGRGGG